MDNQPNPPAPSMPPIPTTEEGGTPPPPAPGVSAPAGSAAPGFDIPPVVTSTPKKKFGGGRIIATILGLLLLVGGIGAGVVLVQQRQLFQQKASDYGTCYCGLETNVSKCTNNCKNGGYLTWTLGPGNCYCKAPAVTNMCNCNSTSDCSGTNTCKTTGSGCTTFSGKTGLCIAGGTTTCTPDGQCLDVNSGKACCNGSYFDSACLTPSQRCGTKPAPSCTADGQCRGTLSCCSGKDYTDSSKCSLPPYSVCGTKPGGGGGCPPSNNNPSCTGGNLINDTCGSLETIWSCSPTGGVTLSCCKQPSGGTTCTGTNISCQTLEVCSGANKKIRTDLTGCNPNPPTYQVCCENISAGSECSGVKCSGSGCNVSGTLPPGTNSSNCYVNHYWCLTRSPQGCSSNRIKSMVASSSLEKDCGTEQIDIYCPNCNIGGDIASGLKYLSKTYTSDCGGGGGGELTAQCATIKVYDTSWNQLTTAQLSALTAGTTIRIAVSGTATSGLIDKAQFTVNTDVLPETTAKKPSSEEFYSEFVIPTGVTSFTVKGKIHHSTLGWF